MGGYGVCAILCVLRAAAAASWWAAVNAVQQTAIGPWSLLHPPYCSLPSLPPAQEGLYLDSRTQRLLAQVVAYNPDLRLFSSAVVAFEFAKGGAVQVPCDCIGMAGGGWCVLLATMGMSVSEY